MPGLNSLDGLVFTHPARTPDLALTDYHLFGPVKDVLLGRHSANVDEMKQSFRDVLRSRGREFYNNDIQAHNHRWQKCVENDGRLCGKINS
jgi:hypothetical protein